MDRRLTLTVVKSAKAAQISCCAYSALQCRTVQSGPLIKPNTCHWSIRQSKKSSKVKLLKKRCDKFIAVAGRGLPEDFSSERKDHRRRSDALDDDTVAAVQQLVEKNPGRFMRSLARELGISE